MHVSFQNAETLLANCVWPSDSSSLWGLRFAAAAAAAAAAADFAGFADWLALYTYINMAQFRILRFTFKGSPYSSSPCKGRTRVNHY